jgi:hypothetical protein
MYIYNWFFQLHRKCGPVLGTRPMFSHWQIHICGVQLALGSGGPGNCSGYRTVMDTCGMQAARPGVSEQTGQAECGALIVTGHLPCCNRCFYMWGLCLGVGCTHTAWPGASLMAPVSSPAWSFFVQLLILSLEDMLNVREGEGTNCRTLGPIDLPEESQRVHCLWFPLPCQLIAPPALDHPQLETAEGEECGGLSKLPAASFSPHCAGKTWEGPMEFSDFGPWPGWRPILGSKMWLSLMRINWGTSPGVAPVCPA